MTTTTMTRASSATPTLPFTNVPSALLVSTSPTVSLSQKVVTTTPRLSPTKIPTLTSTPTPTVLVKSQVKLMPLGDSITEGIWTGGYRPDLWKKLVLIDGDKIDFVGSLSGGPLDLGDPNHEGHGGWTISQLDTYAYNWMKLYQPDIVLLHIGTNDLRGGASSSEMIANLTKLIGDIYAGKPDTYVIVSSLIPIVPADQTNWTNFNASIPGIAAQFRGQGYKIIAIDMSQALTTADLADGIHPNATGNSKMAWTWYPVVSTIYKEYRSQR